MLESPVEFHWQLVDFRYKVIQKWEVNCSLPIGGRSICLDVFTVLLLEGCSDLCCIKQQCLLLCLSVHPTQNRHSSSPEGLMYRLLLPWTLAPDPIQRFKWNERLEILNIRNAMQSVIIMEHKIRIHTALRFLHGALSFCQCWWQSNNLLFFFGHGKPSKSRVSCEHRPIQGYKTRWPQRVHSLPSPALTFCSLLSRLFWTIRPNNEPSRFSLETDIRVWKNAVLCFINNISKKQEVKNGLRQIVLFKLPFIYLLFHSFYFISFYFTLFFHF